MNNGKNLSKGGINKMNDFRDYKGYCEYTYGDVMHARGGGRRRSPLRDDEFENGREGRENMINAVHTGRPANSGKQGRRNGTKEEAMSAAKKQAIADEWNRKLDYLAASMRASAKRRGDHGKSDKGANGTLNQIADALDQWKINADAAKDPAMARQLNSIIDNAIRNNQYQDVQSRIAALLGRGK